MRLLTAVLLGALGIGAAAQGGAASKASAEIEKARATLETSAPESDRAAPIARLDRAKAALETGRLYLAAYLLESGWTGARNFAQVKASADVTTQEAFVKKWTAMGEPRPVAARPARTPAVVGALAAIAEARGVTTYHASRFYGEDSGLFGGLYYLADSHSVMEFAGMVRGLDWPATPPPPAFRSIANEVAAFDVEMTTAYEKMERANHPTYITASAALKQARILNDSGQHAGALFEYLLSRYVFAPLRGPALGEASTARIAAARAALPSGVDHSIAELFLQLADEQLAGGSDAQRRNAATVLEDVLPTYMAALAPASTTTAGAPNAQVTITLVRWPFT